MGRHIRQLAVVLAAVVVATGCGTRVDTPVASTGAGATSATDAAGGAVAGAPPLRDVGGPRLAEYVNRR
jgi:hypothetical protein